MLAAFSHVCDATHAAAELVSRRCGGGLRIAIDAAPAGGDCGGGAPALLCHAGVAEIVVSGRTAPLAGPTLPSGAALIERRVAGGDRRSPDRLYELRLARGGPVAPLAAASNVDWAHRAGGIGGAPDRIADLVAAWDRALGGGPGIAVVTSPGGSAATALAAELALRAHADGALVLRGAWDEASPCCVGAWREALALYAAHRPAPRRLGLDDSDGTSLPPELTTGMHVPSESRPHEAFGEALAGWLRSCSRRAPVLVVLDHVHWAGMWSLELCADLGDELAGERVLLALVGATGGLRGRRSLDAAVALAQALDPQSGVISLDDR